MINTIRTDYLVFSSISKCLCCSFWRSSKCIKVGRMKNHMINTSHSYMQIICKLSNKSKHEKEIMEIVIVLEGCMKFWSIYLWILGVILCVVWISIGLCVVDDYVCHNVLCEKYIIIYIYQLLCTRTSLKVWIFLKQGIWNCVYRKCNSSRCLLNKCMQHL